MSIYSLGGNQIYAIYDKSGFESSMGYDIAGNVVYSSGPTTLTVMTFNAQAFGGVNSQANMMADLLDTYDADIIGFQECVSGYDSIPAGIKNALTNYSNYFFSSHYNYNAIFSKSLVLQNSFAQDYETQDPDEWSNWRETRSYIKSYLSIGGKSICWINTHLAVKNAQPRYSQCAELFDMAEDEDYCIITGDLNHYSTDTSSADWQNMYKQFADAGYNLANCADNNHFVWTYSSKKTASGLDDATAFYAPNCPDNIITSGNIDIINTYFDEIKLSYLNGSDAIDHIPLIVELVIN